jgi:hypothetical protein
LKNKILTQNFSKKVKFLRLKIMCLWVNYAKKICIFSAFKSLKKGVGSRTGVESGSGDGSGSAPKCHGFPTLAASNSSGLV